MKKLWLITRKIVAGILFVTAILVAGAYAFAQTDYARDRLREEVSSRLHDDFGLTATFRDVEVDLLPPRVHILGATVEGSDGRPFVTVERLTVGLAPVALVRGEVEVTELTLEEPDLRLVVRDAELVNLPELRRPAAGDDPDGFDARQTITDLGVLAGRLTVEVPDAPGGPLTVRLSDTNVDVTFDAEGHPAARLLITGGRVTHGEHEYEVEVLQARVSVSEDRASLRHVRASVGDVRLSVPRAVVGLTAPFDVEGSGEIWAPLELVRQLPVSAPPLEGAAHVAVTARRHDGRLELDGDLSVEGLVIGPEMVGAARNRTFGPHAVGTVTADFRYRPEGIRVREVVVDRLAENDGRIVARDLSVDLSAPGWPIQCEVEFDDTQLAHILIDAGLYASRVRLRIFGGGHMAGHLRDGFELLFTPLELRTRDFEVLTASIIKDDAEQVLAIPAALVRGPVFVSSQGVELRGLAVSFGQSMLRVHGDLGFRGANKRMTLDVTTPDRASFRFADIAGGRIAGLTFEGTGSVTARIDGPYNDPLVTGTTSFRDFAIGGIPFGEVRGPIRYQRLLISLPSILGQLDDSRFCFENGRVDFRGGLHVTGRATFDPLRLSEAVEMFGLQGQARRAEGLASGTAEIRLRGDRWQVDVEADLSETSFAGVALGGGRVLAHYDRGTTDVEELVLRRGSAAARIRGRLGRSGTTDFDVAFEGLALRDVNELPAPLDAIDATVRGRARLRGTTDYPQLQGRLDVSPAVYRGVRYGPSRLTVTLEGPVLEVRGGVAGRMVELETAQLTMQDQWPLWVRGSVHGVEVQRLLSAETLPEGMRVRVDATIDAGVDTARLGEAASALEDIPSSAPVLRVPLDRDGRRRPRPTSGGARERPRRGGRPPLRSRVDYGLSGWVRLDDLAIRHPALTIDDTGPIRLDLQRDRAIIVPARLAFRSTQVDADSEFELGGWVSVGSLGLELRARQLDLSFVPGLLDSVDRLRGSADVDCTVGGTYGEPALLGTASVRLDRLALAGLEAYGARDLTAALRFSRNAILIEDLDARFMGGRITGDGRVTLAGLSLDSYRLDATVLDARLALGPRSSAVLNGTVNLTSPRTEGELPVVGGTLEVVRLRYTEPIELIGDLDEMARRRRTEVNTFDPADDSIRIDLRLVGSNNLRIENNLAQARIEVDDRVQPFRLIGTNQVQGFVGTLGLVRHGTLTFRDTEFDIDRGLLVFSDPYEFNPEIDLLATAVRRDWVITLQIFGTRYDPTIVLTSDPPLSEEDIALLLTVGLTREETEQLGYGTAASSAIPELLWSLTGVDEELSRLMPMIDELRVTTDYSERTGRAEPRVRISQRLARNVRLGASAGLGETRDFEANLEVRLGENLSFEAVYENDEDFDLGNIGGDLRWRMEF